MNKKGEATGLVKIKKVPWGAAPARIRQAWVGLILPCHPVMGYPKGSERSVLGAVEAQMKRYGVGVPQDLAIEILDKERPNAAAWWRAKGYPLADECFCFAESEVEIVSGVERQILTHITDEMQGDPNR